MHHISLKMMLIFPRCIVCLIVTELLHTTILFSYFSIKNIFEDESFYNHRLKLLVILFLVTYNVHRSNGRHSGTRDF